MHYINSFQRDVLYVVDGHPNESGLVILDLMGEYYGEDLSSGRLYPALDYLAQHGLISKRSADGRANEYETTAKGKEEMRARRQWENDITQTNLDR